MKREDAIGVSFSVIMARSSFLFVERDASGNGLRKVRDRIGAIFVHRRRQSMKDKIKDGYTRVSSIASAFGGFGSVPQHMLENARDRGEAVHRLIYDTMNFIPVDEDRWVYKGDQCLKGYFDSYLSFWNRYDDAEILFQEKRIDDDGIMLTGEPDLYIRHKGKHILIDWKCSYKAGKHWELQGSGYHHLIGLHQMHPDHILFVRLDKAGRDPEVVEIEADPVQFSWAKKLFDKYMKDIKTNMEDE